MQTISKFSKHSPRGWKSNHYEEIHPWLNFLVIRDTDLEFEILAPSLWGGRGPCNWAVRKRVRSIMQGTPYIPRGTERKKEWITIPRRKYILTCLVQEKKNDSPIELSVWPRTTCCVPLKVGSYDENSPYLWYWFLYQSYGQNFHFFLVLCSDLSRWVLPLSGYVLPLAESWAPGYP